MNRLFAAATLMLIASSVSIAYAQQPAGVMTSDAKTTPAYGTLVLRKAAAEAELQKMLTMITVGHSDVRLKKIELDALTREMERMEMTRESGVPKLTSTYGTLILRQIAVEVELEALLTQVSERHPDVKNKRTELNLLKREIERVLQ